METARLTLPKIGGASEAGPAATEMSLKVALSLVIAMICFVHIVGSLHILESVRNGILGDPDGYMRLVRIELLWQTGAWFDANFPRIDPPRGLVLHWTRPFDVLLISGAWLASSLLGFETALYWWGALLNPILFIAALIAVVWAARPLLSNSALCILAFMIAVQPAVAGRFVTAQPDHHGLLMLLFILLVGTIIRLLRTPKHHQFAALAGILAALALWVSIESAVILVISLAALGVFWLVGNREFAHTLWVLSVTLLIGLAVALLLERGVDGFATDEIDRLSGAHVFLVGLNCLFWSAVLQLERRWCPPIRIGERVLWCVLGLAGAGLAVWAFQPGLLLNPMEHGDPLYRVKNLSYTSELQPAFDWKSIAAGTWQRPSARAILWLGFAIPAIPWLLYRIRTVSSLERRAWVFIGLGILVFLPLAARQVRWAIYPEILLVLPCADMAVVMLDRLAVRISERALGVARPIFVAILCTWSLIPSVYLEQAQAKQSAPSAGASCPLKPLAEFLGDPEGLGASSKRILAFPDYGPELLYRTPHSVFSIQSHRNQPGFRRGYRILSTSNFTESEALLRESETNLIVICPGKGREWYYSQDTEGRSLFEALSADEYPDFLAPLALPEALSRNFKVYAVHSEN